MAWGDRLRAAEPYIIGLGGPIALCLLATIVPQEFSQTAKLAALEEKAAALQSHVDDRFSSAEKVISTQYAALGSRFDDLSRKLDDRFDDISKKLDDRFGAVNQMVAKDEVQLVAIDARLDQQELDPNKILGRFGGLLDANMRDTTAFVYHGRVYLLPRTREIADALTSGGFKREQLTPVIQAFVVTTANAVQSEPDTDGPAQTGK
ncbi:hypothetical protein [Methylocapsa sp. S129]|uniref:hypothetical protein n=1 Tax=Methylocapsa sp. S129 TaxID=1641869 RepID=UPI00131ACE1E|nr:hypothetical protein [Methylocapsa sp. S129]